MCGGGTSVVHYEAQGCSFVANEAANLLHYQLLNIHLPYIVK